MAHQTNHLLAKCLWATIAASRRLRHQNRLNIKRDTIYLEGIGKIQIHGINQWTKLVCSNNRRWSDTPIWLHSAEVTRGVAIPAKHERG